MEIFLHNQLIEWAEPDMTAHELWSEMNKLIEARGFENLDFQGNLGHSIEQDLDDRAYIERDNHKKLSDFILFTFEPHIRENGCYLGYKHEDIFCFCNGSLKAI
jgi:Xaa-Pro aminopeptidase